MKILIFAILFLAFTQCLNGQVIEDDDDVSPNATNKPEKDPSRLDGILDNLDSENGQPILSILRGLRIKADQGLADLFPHFKKQIETLHDINNECYDRTIGANRKIDIFKAKVHNIVQAFFSENPNLLKNFISKEIQKRVKSFLGNLKQLARLVLQCVKDKALGKVTTTYGITPLFIYSLKEFGKTILNPNLFQNLAFQNSSVSDNTEKSTTQRPISQNSSSNLDSDNLDLCSLKAGPSETIPPTFNWLEQGYVSPVYDQGQCKSCYVFATTSALESQYMIKVKKEPIRLSIQTTLNCMPYGCNGGNLEDPMRHFVDNGVALDANAPYVDSMQRCSKKNMTVDLKADHYCNFEQYLSDAQMQLMLLRNGPSAVAIAVNENDSDFQMLKGVWNRPCQSAATELNHAVLLVGWDNKNWIIKNSWGTGWGLDGYLHMPRGENKCGVNSMLGVPIIFRRN